MEDKIIEHIEIKMSKDELLLLLIDHFSLPIAFEDYNLRITPKGYKITVIGNKNKEFR